jgi:hypothetical protein
MLGAKEFLAQECRNVRTLLQNTLRYNYTSESSADIYRECHSRLNILEHGFKILEDDELDELRELWVQLSNLSILIGNIERSHIEEFSWPFARSLRELATGVCGRDGIASPLFFFSSDDELSSYAVETEQYTPGLSQQPLFNIKFPRSLKSFVLLHAILAHELGHAAYAIPKLSNEIKTSVIDKLIHGSALAAPDSLDKWIQQTKSCISLEFSLDRAHASWPEELYCDLFGLLMIGPSYIGANSSLLLPFDMRSVSSTHPPGLTRIWMLNEAVKHLGWTRALSSPPNVKQATNGYLGELDIAAKKVPQKFRLLDTLKIRTAVAELQRIIGTMGATMFEFPPPKLLGEMVDSLLLARPPVESKVDQKLRIQNEHVDFRWILLAGWLVWHLSRAKKKGLSFSDINMLCERAVLIQSAVEHWNSNLSRRSRKR